MTYQDFISRKKKQTQLSGFDIDESKLNDKLFDFQKYAVAQALRHGRYALFEECGLGKTFQQIEWANQVVRFTNEPVLILAPLGVGKQTINEGIKLDIDIAKYGTRTSDSKIYISNYEQLDNIDLSWFSGIVLDESSILKNFEGSTKKKLIASCKDFRFKLACTATPSPNDDMELCNHAEFLNQSKREEILAMYFTHDGGETSKWRLKGHAQKLFWEFVKSWSLFISNPSDIGFDGSKFILPKLNLIERLIETPATQGRLFNDINISATNFNKELRNTIDKRMDEVISIANHTNGPTLIWVKQNIEADYLLNEMDAVEVRGSESPEAKEEKLLAFANGQIRNLITKKKIAAFGMNYQNCHDQIDASPDFSFETTYQAIRRSYRFGQLHPVNYYMIVTDTMQNVLQAIKNKQEQFNLMKQYLCTN